MVTRTVSEETLKASFIEALNEMVGNSSDYLSRLAEHKVHIKTPERGELRTLCEMTESNAILPSFIQK